MDTHERLRQLLNERGWSEYKLPRDVVYLNQLLQIFLGEIQSPPSQHWKQSVVVLASLCHSFLPRGT